MARQRTPITEILRCKICGDEIPVNGETYWTYARRKVCRPTEKPECLGKYNSTKVNAITDGPKRKTVELKYCSECGEVIPRLQDTPTQYNERKTCRLSDNPECLPKWKAKNVAKISKQRKTVVDPETLDMEQARLNIEIATRLAKRCGYHHGEVKVFSPEETAKYQPQEAKKVTSGGYPHFIRQAGPMPPIQARRVNS